MITIHKTVLAITDVQEVSMRQHSVPLSVQMQSGQLCVWCQVSDDSPMVTRRFLIYGTGHDMDERPAASFLGTVQDGPLVWHVFLALHEVIT